MFEKDRANILSIQDSCNKIVVFTAGIFSAEEFYQDQKVFDAVFFIIIGESVGKISEDLKNKYNTVEWNKIKSFRNYFGVDADEVWQIIDSDIPTLQNSIQEIIQEFDT